MSKANSLGSDFKTLGEYATALHTNLGKLYSHTHLKARALVNGTFMVTLA